MSGKKRLILKKTGFLFLLQISLLSCEISGIQSEEAVKDYYFDTLRFLNIKNDINVLLFQDSSDYIRIIAPEDLQKELAPEIKNDTIILLNNNPSNIINRYNQKITAEVHFTNIKIIFHQGGGFIKSADTIRIENLNLWTNGATGYVNLLFKGSYLYFGLSTGSLEIIVKGETNNLNLWTTSYASVLLSDLKSKKVTIRNNSPIDCYIYATNELNANLQYTGNIYYKGDPVIKECTITGTGKLVPIK